MKLSDVNPVAWIFENRVKASSGEPFDLKQHYFWYDVLRDMSPHQVWLKAAQGGGTEVALLKAIYLADRRKMSGIYTMPTASDINILGGRINRLIQQNPSLAALVKDKDTVEQKQVGSAMLYFRGTWTERAAISVPADFLVHDEEDRSNAAILKMYPSRLLHSPHKWDWHFSNPSFPGHGVDAHWRNSDQKHWFIKCLKCNKEQFLSWPESIDRDRKCFICTGCKAPLDRDVRRKGRWVKKFKDKEVSGFWINAMMYPWLDASYFIEQFDSKPKDYFWNFVLGLPYVSEGSFITPDIIYRNCTTVPNSQENVVIGVDVGNTIHYVIGNDEGLFHAGKTEDPEDLDRLLLRFPGSVMVIDRGPDVFYPKKLREKFQGRVFICSFSRVKKTDQIITFKHGEEYGDVLADRNRAIQLVVDEFADRRIPLEGSQDDWSEFYSHFNGNARRKDLDAVGNPVYVWEKPDGNDHWLLATTYWRIGMEKFGGEKGAIVDTQKMYSARQAPEVSLDGKIENPLSYPQEYEW